MNGSNGYVEVEAHDPDFEKHFEPPQLLLEDDLYAQKVRTHLARLQMTGAIARRVARIFREEIRRGLRQLPSSLQMENTYIPELPDGTEEGLFLALDLGGTNFRVLLIELKGGDIVREDVKQYHIGDELRLGHGEDLFNFIADCVLDFVHSEGLETEELPLGFTFSFPMRQHSISSGELTTWTKSFNCGGMEGVDVAALLQKCLNKRQLKVKVLVLLNDTTGTLVAGARTDHRVAIGVIVGTGCNGCYVEHADSVRHWETAHDAVKDVIVDVEWGAFGDNGCLDFIKTDLDVQVDRDSLLSNSFTFEKYIGGKYLGSLLTAALQKLARLHLLPVEFDKELNTADLSLFEEEAIQGGTSETLKRLQQASPDESSRAQWTVTHARVAQFAAALISNRAAMLVAVCVSELLRRLSRPHVVVAVDGSVYKHHPRFSTLLEKYITALVPQHPFSLLSAEDGSGKGSALTSAVAARIARRGL